MCVPTCRHRRWIVQHLSLLSDTLYELPYMDIGDSRTSRTCNICFANQLRVTWAEDSSDNQCTLKPEKFPSHANAILRSSSTSSECLLPWPFRRPQYIRA